MILIKNNIIPFGNYNAMTILPFVFYRDDIKPFTLNHEKIHLCQQFEMLVIGIIIALLMLMFGLGWWSLLAFPIFFYCYCVEWIIKLLIYKEQRIAYRNISFEREAYANERDMEYISKRKIFSWYKFI